MKLKGFKFTLKYREVKYPMVVCGIEDRPAFAQTFKTGGGGPPKDGEEEKKGEENGKEEEEQEDKSVITYLEETYKIKFHDNEASMPCVRVRGRTGPAFFPLSQCVLAKGTPYDNSGGQPGKHVSDIIKIMNVQPQNRFRDSKKMLEEAWRDGNVSQELGLDFSNDFIQVKARFIPPPDLLLDRECIRGPEVFRYNFRNKRVFEGVSVENWAVVCVGRMRESPNQFSGDFMRKMQEMGLRPNDPTECHNIEARDIERCFQDLVGKMRGTTPPLIICPLGDDRDYALVKKFGDRLGLTTQCLLPSKMFRGGRSNPQYVSNVVLKINSKLGGIDKVVHAPGSNEHLLQTFFTGPTMVCGMAMSEDAPGSVGNYSVVSLVGSLDMFADKYAHSARNVNKGMKEIDPIVFRALFKEVLYEFFNSNGCLPSRILFYRMGVSTGSIPKLLEREATQILELGKTDDDIKNANSGAVYTPQVSMILVQRRHHMRFYTEEHRFKAKNNIQPGVCVDSGVTNTGIFEFYLFSHTGIQGTSCPTHYRVLLNDVEDLDSNHKIQDLTYYLSFEYAKTLTPVSMVTPCYYALNNANKVAKYSRDDDVCTDGMENYLVSGGMRGRNTFN